MGDHLAHLADVGLALELESDLAQPAEPQIKLSVEIEGACGLDGEGLDLVVRQRRVVLTSSP